MPELELIEVNLPGLRQRRFLTHTADLRRTVSIIGVCNDGSVFLIGANSFEGDLTQLVYIATFFLKTTTVTNLFS